MNFSDQTLGLVELASDVSHDEAEADWYDVDEYLDLLPNPHRTLQELIRLVHESYL